MEINAVNNERKMLESAIFALIKEFENRTQTSVEYVRVDKVSVIGERLEVSTGVSIHLTL
jgi:hypothetical protein